MADSYRIPRTQVAILRALQEGDVERSPLEIAVSARLLPNKARAALAALVQLELVTSRIASTGEDLFVLTDRGEAVSRVLAQQKCEPPIGMRFRIPTALPSLAGWIPKSTQSYFPDWLTPQSQPYIEIVPDESDN